MLLYTFSVLNPSCLLLLPLPNAIGVTPPLHCLPQPAASLKLDAPPHTCYRFLQLPPPSPRHAPRRRNPTRQRRQHATGGLCSHIARQQLHAIGRSLDMRRRRSMNDVAVPVSIAAACKSSQSHHLKQRRPTLLATVANHMLTSFAVVFISSTASIPAAHGCRCPSRRRRRCRAVTSVTRLVVKRAFRCHLPTLAIHDAGSTFGRMLPALPVSPICQVE